MHDVFLDNAAVRRERASRELSLDILSHLNSSLHCDSGFASALGLRDPSSTPGESGIPGQQPKAYCNSPRGWDSYTIMSRFIILV